jgi:hypothetical protein
MKENSTAISDIITLVACDQRAEANPILNDLLGSRVLDSLQGQKELLAKNLFAPSADTLAEELVQEEHESVEDFVKRGGKIKHVAAANAKGSQPAQTIKKAKSYFHSTMRGK